MITTGFLSLVFIICCGCHTSWICCSLFLFIPNKEMAEKQKNRWTNESEKDTNRRTNEKIHRKKPKHKKVKTDWEVGTSSERSALLWYVVLGQHARSEWPIDLSTWWPCTSLVTVYAEHYKIAEHRVQTKYLNTKKGLKVWEQFQQCICVRLIRWIMTTCWHLILLKVTVRDGPRTYNKLCKKPL